jgi:hypothetical protein
MSTAATQGTFLKDLLADPVKYPDATKYLTADGKETTLGDLRQAAKTQIVKEAPASPNEETDKHVSEILESKKKKKHPVEARIAELTAKAKDAEEQRKKDKEEFEKKLAEQNEKNIAAELERRKAAAAAADKRPEKQEGQSDADFAQKMAEWVIRQQDKIVAKPAPVTDTVAQPNEVEYAQRKAEWDNFIEKDKEYVKRNPDSYAAQEEAVKRGVVISDSAKLAVIKLAVPEVLHYLAKPENDATARAFMKLDGFAQAVEVGRIAERLKVSPSDFVSRAPAPGPRLTGGAVTTADETDPDKMDVDTYLMKRRADIKAGVRRR